MLDFSNLETRAANYRETAKSILSKAGSEGRDLSKSEQTDFDSLQEKISAITRTLSQGRQFSELHQASQQAGSAGYAFTDRRDSGEGMKTLAKLAISLVAAKGHWGEAGEICERRFGDSGIAKTLSAGSLEGGGAMVPGALAREVIEALRPASVVRRMGASWVDMPAGTLSVPKITVGATASWTAENENISVSEQTFGMITLTRKKLAVITPISNDLIRYSSPSAVQIVQADLTRAIAQAEDLAFIRGDGTGGRPRGLRYWAPAANVLTVNATVNLTNIRDDLRRIRQKLFDANVPMVRPGWVMNPRTFLYLSELTISSNEQLAFPELQATPASFRGYPFAITTQIPTNLAVTGTSESELYLADFASVVIGDAMNLSIDIATEGAYADNAGTVHSLFSKDQSAIRLIMETDFAMRHDASVAVFSDLDWGA